MTEEKFIEGISKALNRLITQKEFLDKRSRSRFWSWYCCDVIGTHISHDAKREYKELVDPSKNICSFSYFGTEGTEEALKERQTSILIFEQNCLLYGTYKKF